MANETTEADTGTGTRQAGTTQETLEGYVVDIACIRKSPRRDLLARARRHSKACNLMGHCVESGYGLIDDEGGLFLLDDKATLDAASVIAGAPQESGIKLRVQRRAAEDGVMQTRKVELV